MNTAVKETTKEIIQLLKEGKGQWEIHHMGYPLGTIRYWHFKLKHPIKHNRRLAKQKERMQINWQKKKAEKVTKEVRKAEKKLSTKAK